MSGSAAWSESPPRPQERPPVRQHSSSTDLLKKPNSAEAAVAGQYRVDAGYDLDQYLCRYESPLNFSIDIPDSFGPVTNTGAPAPGNSLYDKTLGLTMRIFDVDEESGEVDYLYVNGNQQARKLSGANDQWSINTYPIPSSQLRLPTAGNPTGTNDFYIDIDTTDDGWCVEIDYAVVSLDAVANSTPPAVFVHGITGNNGPNGESTMHNFKEAFIAKVPAVQGRAIAPPLTQHSSIETNAGILATKIDEITAPEIRKDVTLVAHSMGGLASRKYAWDHPDRVDKVVMVATPNAGSELADKLCSIRHLPWYQQSGATIALNQMFATMGPCQTESDGLYQLQTSYVRDVFNSQVPDKSAVGYATIAGMGNGFASAILPGEDDGAVTVASVRWLDAAQGGKHTSLGPVLNLTHSELTESSSPAVNMSVCYLYGTSHPGCSQAAASNAQANATPADWASADGVNEDIAAGATRTFPVSVPAGAQASLVVYRTSSDVQLSMTGGATFSSASMFDQPVQVAMFTGPQTLTVRNTSASAQGIISFLQVQSTRVLEVEAPSLVAPTDTVKVNATLSPALGADAPAWRLTNNSGAVVTSGTFTAAGPAGKWTAQFTAPANGAYSLTSWVAGTQPRSDTRALLVNNSAQLVGLNSTLPTDTNGNGLYDTLGATFSTTVVAPGDYRVAARLTDDAGNVIATGSGAATLQAGSQFVNVDFPGTDIYAGGQDGPWHVSTLTLSKADGTVVDILDDAGDVLGYGHASFEHASLNLRPNVTDKGTDADSNGKYDTLEVLVKADVVDSGSYDVNGRLLDSQGNEITQAQANVWLDAGARDITLSFDGYDISAHRKRGPYTVADFSIYPTTGGGSGVSVITLHKTAAYRATDFERVPGGEPQPPTGVVAKAGNESATVSWVAPADPGEAPIADYTVTSSPGSKVCHSATTTCTVNGLTNGTPYTFKVVATNGSDLDSPASAPSAPVTPFAPLPPTPDPSPSPVVSTPAPTPTPVVTVTPTETTPGPVTGLKKKVKKSGKKAKSSRVTLTWTPATGASGHQVRIALGKKGYGSWKPATAASFTFKAKKGQKYRVQVRGVTAVTFGVPSTLVVKVSKR